MGHPREHARRIDSLVGAADASIREASQGGTGSVYIHVDDPDVFGAIAQVLMDHAYDFQVDAAFELPPIIQVTDCHDPEAVVGAARASHPDPAEK